MIILMAAAFSSLSTAGSLLVDEQKLMAVLNGDGYTSINEMPNYVWQAFVSVEDHRFMSHSGVDQKALVRAFVVDVRAGSYVQGGSTITMQLQ